MRKYTKDELFKMEAVDIYKLIISNKINRFPAGYWEHSDCKINAAKCTRYLIEEILKYDEETLKAKISLSLFNENYLNGMLQTCFDRNVYKAIDNAYPNKFKQWELNIVSKGYWTIDTGIMATKWLIEEKLKLNDDELKEQLSQQLFRDNKLNGMLQLCFNNSPYEAINNTYPNKFKEWEFKNVPRKYWNDKNNIKKATKWLIEEKLKLNDDELKEQLSTKLFYDNGLSGMLKCLLKSSPYMLINETYPNKFKEWEFKNVPIGFWENKNNGIKATKWLIEEKLKLSNDELKKQLNAKLFIDNGLGSMLYICFNSSPYKAINATYPNKFMKYDFKGYANENI